MDEEALNPRQRTTFFARVQKWHKVVSHDTKEYSEAINKISLSLFAEDRRHSIRLRA